MKPSSRRLVINDTPRPKLAPEPPPPSATTDPTAATAAAAAAQFDSSSMAVTALVLISAIFFLGFFSIFVRRLFSDSSSSTDLNSRPSTSLQHRRFVPASAVRGLDPSAVHALPLSRYTGGGSKEGAQCCVVCLSEFEEEEMVKVIPGCGHVFHPRCIEAWLIARGSCPLCRCSEMAAWRNKGVCLEVVVGREEEEEEDSEREGGSDDGGGGGSGEGEGEGEEEEASLGVVVEGGIEEVGREEKKVVLLGRSSSWSWRRGREERAVFLRRTCSL